MNHVEIKRIDYDCYKVIVDGSALVNELNAGYFTRHDIECLGDACQIAMMDAELSAVKLSRAQEELADEARREARRGASE
jgi:hypothetical protein